MRKIKLINRKGQVIIYVTLAVVVLILFVGLAIDSGDRVRCEDKAEFGC